MRILIVEDEAKIADSLKASLEAEFFAVDHASDGERGSFLARTNDYDLIILDNILPKKNGSEVCAEIRAEGLKVPILMLSVEGASETKIDLLNVGADDYMTKPFVLGELLARIRALLRRPQQSIDNILTIDNLTVNPQRCIVTRGEREIYLPRKEFALIEYMIRNKGIALSRSMIMEHVWDENADPFSNTIESHILSLRKKIDLGDERKLIHTLPGRGYILDVRSS